ncbi:MAG: 50S ribosomal protein L11 methyltransferase [Actinomycetota bacterium]
MSVLVVRVAPDEIEACSDWLFQLGATAIEERRDPDETTLAVGFRNDDAALAARSVLSERWACRLEDTGDEAAWRDRWLHFLEPIDVGPLTIHAPWHDMSERPAAGQRRISIDPGRAFGSGHHPTTQLAIEALARVVEPDDRVLDAGCGTGILSIAAAAFGAARVTGVDLDHDILAVAEGNVIDNGFEQTVELTEISLLELTRSFDVVVANIVIGDLRPLLAPLLARAERRLILSGFLVQQLDDLVNELDDAVDVAGRTERDGWGCVDLQPR